MYVYYEKKVETVIVSNSTKNQQNEQSPPTLTQRTQKDWYITLEIHVLAWDRHTHVGGGGQLIRFTTTPSW